jgi:hypothetical protein
MRMTEHVAASFPIQIVRPGAKFSSLPSEWDLKQVVQTTPRRKRDGPTRQAMCNKLFRANLLRIQPCSGYTTFPLSEGAKLSPDILRPL